MANTNNSTLTRLHYLLQHDTMQNVCNAIRVSPDTLFAWHENIQRIPSEYNTVIRNTYQRTGYAMLRTAGLPSTLAKKYSEYSPTKLDIIQIRVSHIVDNLAEGAYQQHLKALRNVKNQNLRILTYEQIKHSIREGLRKSRKTINEWEEYF